MTKKYYQIVGMAKDDPAKAQKEMLNLAKKYTDDQLAEIWQVSVYKVRELRYQLGISKVSTGDIKDVEDPGNLNVDIKEKSLTSLSKKDTFDLTISGVFTGEQILAYLDVIEHAVMTGSEFYELRLMLKEKGR